MVILSICCGLLFAGYAALIIWYAQGWAKIPEYSGVAGEVGAVGGSGGPPAVTRISVIVPVRNEEKNIPGLLASLAAQRYPNELFQVVVIDDHSTDRSWELLNGQYHPELFCVKARLANEAAGMGDAGAGMAYKKMAIEAGVGLSTGELIVTTDADCRFDPDWLRTIADFHAMSGAKCIAAPVKIDAGGSLLSIFQALDFITLQGITGGALETGLHTLGNGANLAYEKEAFTAVDGFRDVDHIPSGDDMFLMHKIARRYPGGVRYLKARPAIVLTEAAGGWRAFLNQRIRWASKADRYEEKRIFWILLLVWLVNLEFVAMGIAAVVDHRYFLLLAVLFLLKIAVEFPFVYRVAGFFGQRRFMGWFPVMQPLHICYTLFIGLLGKFGGYEWKGRKITK
ncbi:MAG: glycosyltransferase [Bacteroidota bacterium]|nr:glycosyltransferase [Bacteroidota bacterium]MDP4218513.1 glycosyltransferase [Bacteroidota bacterium]MDP4245314.1 glycosyltransferase [Bacteroidota bacterium]MDP4260792.1 glycosyltransferase [Bacteroidota bacterium]